jgi:chromosome segregation ATPase
LLGAREAQAASAEAHKQAGREHAKALKELAAALSSAQEEVRRGKEVEASAEREAAKLVSKLSVYESRQDVQLGVIADSAEACAKLQQQLEEANDKISSLGETLAQLNEEVELLSAQKAKLAGDSEQYAMQVRDLVMATGKKVWEIILDGHSYREKED